MPRHCTLIVSACTGLLWNDFKQHFSLRLIFPGGHLSITCMLLKWNWNKLFLNTLEDWDSWVNSTFWLTVRQRLYIEIKIMRYQKLRLMVKEILQDLWYGCVLQQDRQEVVWQVKDIDICTDIPWWILLCDSDISSSFSSVFLSSIIFKESRLNKHCCILRLVSF